MDRQQERQSEHDENSPAVLHQQLISQLAERHLLDDPAVADAFLAVPRHHFLPEVEIEQVYRDQAIGTKFENGVAISSSSQPAIMAIMLEQLDLQPGQRVLEIGAGTGYNAALLAHIVGSQGQVITVDIDEDIAAGARENLARAGFERVQVICADGGHGHPDGGPYDRIILTVSANDVLTSWWEQMKDNGRLVMPLALNGPQKSVAFQKTGDHLVSVSVRDCGFMRLRGAFASRERLIQLGGDENLMLGVAGDVAVDEDQLYRLLAETAGQRRPTTLEAAPRELWGGLMLWLAIHEKRIGNLFAAGDWLAQEKAPYLFVFEHRERRGLSVGVLGDGGCAFLAHPPNRPPPWERTREENRVPFTLHLSLFGAAEPAARRLSAHIAAWEAAGRPGTAGLHLRAYPAAFDYQGQAGALLLRKEHSCLVLDWTSP